jgi:hypothetical protein
MAFGGGKFWWYAVWILRKKIQVFVRTYLSHVFALALALLVLVREWDDLSRLATETKPPSGFEWLIVILTLGTIIAACWELWGNKLSTSPQEIRFLSGMRYLLFELEKFAHGEDRNPNAQTRLNRFVEGFLEVSRSTLCGNKLVDAGFMVKLPGEEKLKLVNSSKEANYPTELEIPLPTDGTTTGPAGVAFQKVCLTYMPKKKWMQAWPFRLVAGEDETEWYEPSEPTTGWIAASDPETEKFRSVLCAPVAVYHKKDQKQRFGVINFSTLARDPFVDRDFMMAECFASVLGHALTAVQNEVKQRPELAEVKQAPEGPA